MEQEKLSQAVQTLGQALNVDEELRLTYKANIAMAFKDTWAEYVEEMGRRDATEHIHEIANDAADRFRQIFTTYA